MVSVLSGVYIGSKMGTTERGKWFQISLVNNGEPYQLRTNKEVYEIATNLAFGDEVQAELDIRYYNNGWSIRVERITI